MDCFLLTKQGSNESSKAEHSEKSMASIRRGLVSSAFTPRPVILYASNVF